KLCWLVKSSVVRTCETPGQRSRRMLKKAVQLGRRRVETGGVVFLTRPPHAAKTACPPRGYVEDFDEPRTTHGNRRVLARWGWAGEKNDFFSILLRRLSHCPILRAPFAPTHEVRRAWAGIRSRAAHCLDQIPGGPGSPTCTAL